MKAKYCFNKGSSNPKEALSASTSAFVASFPAINRAGSPGIIWMNIKIKNETASGSLHSPSQLNTLHRPIVKYLLFNRMYHLHKSRLLTANHDNTCNTYL